MDSNQNVLSREAFIAQASAKLDINHGSRYAIYVGEELIGVANGAKKEVVAQMYPAYKRKAIGMSAQSS